MDCNSESNDEDIPILADSSTEQSEEVSSDNFNAREYQDELLPLALKNNCIIYLPTGSGKTFLATMIIKHFSHDIEKKVTDGGKRAFFLVNTVALVEQQAKSIERQTTFKIGQYTGATGCDLWPDHVWKREINANNENELLWDQKSKNYHNRELNKRKWKEVAENMNSNVIINFSSGEMQVIVMTAQILLNLLIHNYIKLSNIRVIVFDECHNAVKDHPMRCIMKFFKDKPQDELPHVVGLTGSLLNSTIDENEIEKYIRDLEMTFQSLIITSIDERMAAAIQKYSADPEEIIVPFSPGHHMSNDLSIKVNLILDGVITQLRVIDLYNQDNQQLPHKPTRNSEPLNDVALLNKKLINLVEDVRFQLSNLGAYGCHKAALSVMILLERKKRSANNETHFISYSNVITTLTLVRKLIASAIEAHTGKDKVRSFISNKVIELLNLLHDFKETDRALIFVTRRFTCKCLQYIIKDINLPNMKSDFMVGFNVNPFNDTREGLLEKKTNKKVLKNFNAGLINTLVASDVIEEGIDVQACNIVVKFDTPGTLRSYIQSKGRARSRTSKYYIMTERDDLKFSMKLKKFRSLEQRLKKELVEKFLDRTPATKEELDQTIFKSDIEPFRPMGEHGPQIEGAAGISLINRYCLSMYCDRFSKLTPYWWKEKLSNDGHSCFVVHLQLPNSSPVRQVIASDPSNNIEMAKRSAALKACALLYECKELDDKLLPCGKKSEVLQNPDLFPCWREENSDKEVMKNSKFSKLSEVGTKKCKSIYMKKFPDCMFECRPKAGDKVYMHIISMKPVYDPPTEVRKKAFYNILQSSNGYAFLSTKQWPTLLKFPLFLTIGEIEVELRMNVECQSLTEKQIDEIFNFQCTIFSEVLQCINSFVFRDYENKEQSYLLAPVKLDGGIPIIDWAVIRNNQEMLPINPPTVEERTNIVVTEEAYLNAVVIPWYRAFLPRQAYIVTSLSKTETALSKFPSGEYPTYENYFVTKYNIVGQLYSADQPLLEVRALSKKMNCLKPRQSVKAISKRKRKQEEEFEESLVPELCVRSNLPAVYWLKSSLLPSLVHRITSLLLADELRSRIATDLQLGYQVLPPGKTWSPIKVDHLCLKEAVEAAQPIVPTAKTVTIKPRKTLDVESVQYPWGSEQEPIDLERHIEEVKLVDILFYEEFVSKPIFKNLSPGESPATGTQKVDQKCDFPNPHETPALSIFLDKSDVGVQLADVLQVLTAASAHDIFNLERLETLGDSFLKYSVSLILFTRFPQLSEGQLTMIKGKIIGNRNLFYCGEEKGLGSIIKNVEFNTESDWMAPGFCVERALQKVMRELNINPRCLYEIELTDDETNSGKLSTKTSEIIEEKLMGNVWEEDTDIANYSNAHLISQQVISNKTVSDSVEALLGLYIKSCGIERGFQLLSWLKVTKPELITPDVYSKQKVSPEVYSSIGQINFHIHQPDYLEKLINYKFKNRAFLLQALSHPTYQPNNITPTYQRLEFLGDAILDFLITTYIFEYCDNLTPGELTDLRSALVNNVTLASISVRIGLHKFLLVRSIQLSKVIDSFVDRQESRNHEFIDETLFLVDELDCSMGEAVEVPKILGDVFESLVGAIFLDSERCLETTWAFIYRFMKKEIDMFSKKVPKNHVRLLYEENVQCTFRKSLRLEEQNKVMVTLEIVVADKVERFYGFGETKKHAKKAAAKMALRFLRSE